MINILKILHGGIKKKTFSRIKKKKKKNNTRLEPEMSTSPSQLINRHQRPLSIPSDNLP